MDGGRREVQLDAPRVRVGSATSTADVGALHLFIIIIIIDRVAPKAPTTY